MPAPDQGDIPKEFTDKARGIRLQKALAEAGIASRRECENMIAGGQVRVNQKLVTGRPAWVDPANDIITVDGRPVRRPGKAARHVYIMLNKPRHVVCTTRDPEGRQKVTDLVKLPDHPRLYPIGRLDAESTGLILLTNDGELTQRLTHPRYEVTKTYHVSVRGRMTDEVVSVLERGLFLAPRRTGGARGRAKPRRATAERVRLLSRARSKSGDDRSRLEVTLAEGQNREIRRMLARLGYKVRRLERVAIGKLQLKGLGPGQWRMLTSREVGMLKRM